jgi:hypothetical chaperone protein
MGANMVLRLMKAGHEVVVWDHSAAAIQSLASQGAVAASSPEDLAGKLTTPKAIWMMIPAAYVDETIAVFSPLLGKGDSYTVWGKPMPIPAGWYLAFARWHQLSLMRAPKILADIAEVARTAQHPDRLRHLVMLVEEEAGYALYRAVSGVKAALSRADHATLSFRHEDFVVEAPIARAELEAWIAPDLARMGAAVDAALADAGLAPGQVDRVFLTGGTSLIPAVRGLFEARFGAAKIAGGGEFVSVAEGLALMGVEAAR